jgi:GNAT superfamily N-acetyltransferase
MLESINLVYHQVIEALTEGGLKDIFRPRVYWNRLVTPTVMELSTTNLPVEGQLQNAPLQFVEINLEDLKAGKWSFAIPSRGLKAWRNLRRGFRCFAVIEGNTAVGDVWCLVPDKEGKPIYHTDLDMLGISCENGDAYAFDMFIAHDYRGKNLAVPLQRFLQAKIKMEGCKRVYGYYWDDNRPALWMHRMLRFKELPKRRVSRLFFLVRSKETSMDKASNLKV